MKRIFPMILFVLLAWCASGKEVVMLDVDSPTSKTNNALPNVEFCSWEQDQLDLDEKASFIPPPEPLIFTVTSPSYIDESGKHCVNIEAFNFIDIAGFQFAIAYDKEVLSGAYLGSEALSNFSQSDYIVHEDYGAIVMSYLAEDIANGETHDNGTSILRVCFDSVEGESIASELSLYENYPTEVIINTEEEIPFVFNGGMVNVGGTVSTTDVEQEGSKFNVLESVVTDMVSVTIDTDKKSQFVLCNTAGQQLYTMTQEAYNTAIDINISSLASGVYYLQCRTGDTLETYTIVKQ